MAEPQRQNALMVHLTAFSVDGTIVEEASLAHEQYYGQSNQLIDSEIYRSHMGVVTIRGVVFDGEGNKAQVFESHYDRAGRYLNGKATYKDGTVIEN
ncbi:MAG TPA: hypothetical protein VFW87_16170 [Pirellulales bacterium]|nr:hypothetical protein [Pirellulales bacterium]